MNFPPELAVEQVKQGITSIPSLPDDVFGKAKATESFDDIMAQLSRSQVRSGMYFETDSDLAFPRELGESGSFHAAATAMDTPQRGARKTGLRRAVHPQPFGRAPAVGGNFGMPGILHPRDLTPWEQERAIRPERSWHTSSMTCVQRPLPVEYQRAGGSFSPSSTSSMSSPLSKRAIQTGHTLRASPSAHRQLHDEEEEILRPVRTAPATSSTARAARRRQIDRAQEETMSLRLKSPEDNPSHPCDRPDSAAAQEFQQLCDRRRRLAGELQHTERRLKEVASLGELDMCFSKMPGGGGGAPMRPRPKPTAGGPFVGKRTNLTRSMSESRTQSFNQSAADSYNYLGPGSDGPSLEEIHPLWS